MDQQPKIPTLKDSQKPQVKVRGLEAGVTLFDRLKQFKKKDLAFILAGLGTLFMAPLAEHFMMSPDNGDATLSSGFGGSGKGQGNGNGIFGGGGGGNVGGYDSLNGQAPGSAIGGGSDVITPLNVRDPSALVMGPGATQQPPTNSVAPASPPPTAPATASNSDLKDALAASARGVGAGARAAKALLPIPKIALNSSGLRGLGAVSGGGGSSASSGGGISSNGLTSGKANAGGGGLNLVHSAPGYKGVGPRGQSSGGGGGLEALKNAAGNAGDVMNRGSALNALDTAASAAIPNGGGGFGGGAGEASGGGDKAGGGNQGKDSKNTGESLEFIKQKAMQEAKIALWAKEQEQGDTKLEMLKIRNTAAETFATEMVKGASAKVSACLFKGFKNKDCAGTASDPGYVLCKAPLQKFDGDGFGSCSDGGDVTMELVGDSVYACKAIGSGDKAKMIREATPMASGCESHLDSSKTAAGAAPANQNHSVDPNGPHSAGENLTTPPASMTGGYCSSLTSLQNAFKTGDTKSGISANVNDPILPYVSKEQSAAQGVVSVRNALAQGSPANDCSAPKLAVEPPVYTSQNQAITFLTGVNGAIPGMLTAVTSYSPKAFGNPGTDNDPKTAADSALDNVAKAGEGLDTVNKYWASYVKANLPIKTSVVQSDLTRLKASDAQTAFDGIDAAYKMDEKALATHNKVQKLFDSGGNDDIVTALIKAAGTKGDTKGSTVAGVLKSNVAFDSLTNKDLAAVNQKEPQAFTVTKPNADVVKDASAGGSDAVKTATDAANKALKTAKDDVAAYAKAIGATIPPDTTQSTDGQTNATAAPIPAAATTPMPDAEKAKLKAKITAELQQLPKVYESMWKAQAGDLNALSKKVAKANAVLAGGK